jgi:hypothetical protein
VQDTFVVYLISSALFQGVLMLVPPRVDPGRQWARLTSSSSIVLAPFTLRLNVCHQMHDEG